ncbi:MAG: WG repeat-containing protein [Bacteroidetes bacterium]|nr:WG repeat-containing protein [Bacteroidota bacterium]MBU1718878.1 WG repeat-containing protein [Bacteroidota bacterium]
MKTPLFAFFFTVLISISTFGQTEEPTIKMKRGNKYGFCDKQRKVLIPCVYDAIMEFSDGLVGAEIDGLWGFIGVSGDTVIPFLYEAVGSFHDGLAPVTTGKLWGFVNKSGEMVIPLQYENAWEFNDKGRAMVQLNGEVIFINTKGEQIIL